MADLERTLRSLDGAFPFPPTPDLARAVELRLRRRATRRRILLASAAAATAALAATLAASPGARSAVVDFLDSIPGVHIERASKLPAVPFNFVPAYGERLSLEEARRRVDYPIRLPQGVGEPYRLFLSSYTVPHGVITAVYGDERHTRLVFTQWRVGGGDLFFKVLGPGSEATRVTVDGAPGIWLFGKRHAVVFVGADGREYRTVGALAGHTLVWQRNGKSYRLEAELSQATALELAESIH